MATFKDTLLLIDKVSAPLQKITDKMAKTQQASSKLQAKFTALNNKMQTLAPTSMKVLGAVSKLTKSFIGLVGASGALTMGIKAAAAYGDRIDKMSQKIGMGQKAFQEWDYIMSQNGGNVESLQMGFKTLTNQIEGVQKGSKDSINAFKALGISVKDSNGQFRSQDDIFNDSIRALQKIQDPTKKAMLANRLFGRSATELRPLLNQEADAIDNLRKKANKLGLIMSEEDVKNAVEFTDTMDTLGRFFQARINKALSQILPKLSKIFEDLMAFKKPIDVIFKTLGKLAQITFSLLTFLGKHWEILVGIGAALAVIASPALWTAIVSGFTALVALVGGLSLPFIAVAAAIGLLVTGIIYCWKKFEGFRKIVLAVWSVIQLLGSIIRLVLVSYFQYSMNVMQKVISWFSSLRETISGLPTPIQNLGKVLFGALFAPLKAIWDIIQLVISGLQKVGGFRGLGDKIKTYADAARGNIDNTTNNITNNTNSGNTNTTNNTYNTTNNYNSLLPMAQYST